MNVRAVWIIEVTVFVLVIAGMFWAWSILTNYRESVLGQALVLERRPEEQISFASVQAEINRRQDDFETVRSLIVERNDLGEVIGSIERVAGTSNVLVSLPEVEERQLVDESGTIVPPSGPIQEVRISIVASGDPRDLLDFIYRVENLPYLVWFEGWRLDTEKQVTQNTFVNAPSERFEQVLAGPQAVLDATLFVNVYYHGG